MTDEHPLMRKARANLGLSTPVDGFDAFIDKINEAHYTDANPRPGHQDVELVMTTKADIANSRHLASPETMNKLAWMTEEVGHPAGSPRAESHELVKAPPDPHYVQHQSVEQRLDRIEHMLERLVQKFLH